jgi:peroxisomal 3,2-trans-enoyl-CoA isomerase
MPTSKISVNVSQGIATITLNKPHRLNALAQEGSWFKLLEQTTQLSSYWPVDYDEFANSLRAIDKREDVVATVWQGKRALG